MSIPLPGQASSQPQKSHAVKAHAFSLTEVVIAIGVASFCLIAIFGMIPAGLNSNQASLRETLAASLTSSIISDLRSTVPHSTATTSSIYNISFPAAGQSATNVFFLNEDGSTNSLNNPATLPAYRATVVINSSATRAASSARIFLTWPVTLNSSQTGLPATFSDAFETVVGIDR